MYGRLGGHMYQVAICENEREAMERLCALLEECYGGRMRITEYVEGADLLDEWERAGRQLQEIILMDIRFQDEDGISVAKKLQQRYPHAFIIFVTGFVEYASEIFEADPVYFLLKPVSIDKLCAAMERAIRHLLRDENDLVAFSEGGSTVQLMPRNISYMESHLHEVHIHEVGRIWSLHGKLSELTKRMPIQFLRVHQSYLVNMDYIVKFTKQEIVLQDGSRIPISRARQLEASKRFLNYLHGKMRG